jgi:4-hydroxy-2-oxoheptanedioate aldolase
LRATATLKSRIARGDRILGTVINLPSPQLVEMAGYLGFDYVVIDAEHGPLTISHCEEMVRSSDAAGIPAVVRVARNAPDAILRSLDIGASGVQVPHIRSEADARDAVQAAYYFPHGSRSLATPRAAGYGVTLNPAEYAAMANQSIVVIAQIEETEAVKHLPSILAVPNIDLIFVGRVDLSQSLGLPGRTDAPETYRTVSEIEAHAHAAGRPLAMSVPDRDAAIAAFAAGYQVVTIVATTLLARAAKSYLAAVRRSLGS